MNTRILTALNVVTLSLGLTTLAVWPTAASADPQAAATTATEDVLHMSDGRVLRGKILSESASLVVFEYNDTKVNIRTKMTISKETVALIERGVAAANPVAAEPVTKAAPAKSTSNSDASNKGDAFGETPKYGITRAATDSMSVPSVYIVPFKGQMGTDVRSSEYQKVVEDIRKTKPSVIILDVKSSDTSELMHPEGFKMERTNPRGEWGMLEFEDYRKLVNMFRNDLRDIKSATGEPVRQVVWVHDADGISATIIMAWDTLYMTPDARLGAKVSVLTQSNAKRWGDSDVRAKMIAAWSGIAKGFLEKGGYSLALADAMVDEAPVLSATWRGRDVVWQLNDDGEYVVDGSDRHAAYFTAKSAEDFCISDGTADTLDDLALLLGFREYRIIDGVQGQLDEYVQRWRKTYRDSQTWLDDYEQHLGWAGGEDTVKWLGRAKSDIEKIVSAMEQYPAVEVRWQRDYGVEKLYFVTLVERMKEQLAALKKRTSGGAGGSGGGGRRGGGGGGLGG